ncbi:GntR family transcriptional regulator [Escherichia coli]|nr:GntR family transcriptional regulator [Escherichia coli]MCJ8388009.1 GntR family transcriptional regulator [Escherichia coli]
MKIVQTSLSESVTQHLAERILCGELPAGSVLPGENELATVYRGG